MEKNPYFPLKIKNKRFPIEIGAFCFITFLTCVFSCTAHGVKFSSPFVCAVIRSSGVFCEDSESPLFVFPLFSSIDVKENTPSVPPPEKDTDNAVLKLSAQSEVQLSNLTGINIDKSALLSSRPEFLSDKIEVLILHTHTTESYTPSDKYNFTPTDSYRTLDCSFNTVKVGSEIEKILKEANITVYHATDTNDYPSYNGSYNKSCSLAEKYIKEHPGINIILDIHRDAIEPKNGKPAKYITETASGPAAALMLVVGSNASGLAHNNWQSNLSFALSLQDYIANEYPTLMRPINFRPQRFNQHLAPGALILEVGSNGNTLDEAILGAQIFARKLCSFLKNE